MLSTSWYELQSMMGCFINLQNRRDLGLRYLNNLISNIADCQITKRDKHIDGLAQDCGNSSALAMELPHSIALSQEYKHINNHPGFQETGYSETFY